MHQIMFNNVFELLVYEYIVTTPSSSHSPFDDDGHMEYLFLEKRH